MKKSLKDNFLICFIGIDGSGKTTIAKKMVEEFNNKEFKTMYVYNTYKPFFAKPLLVLAKLLFLKNKDMYKNYDEYYSAKKNLSRRRLLYRMYQNSTLFDYVVQTFLKVNIPYFFGRNIVCDRYAYDVAVNLAVEFDYSNDEMISVLNRLLKVLPKPHKVFLMDVQEDLAFSRKDDVPSVEYLRERRNIYLDIGKEYDMMILDGAKSLKDLENLIQNEVLECMEALE